MRQLAMSIVLLSLLSGISWGQESNYPYPHFDFLRGQISIELFRVLAMLQPTLYEHLHKQSRNHATK